MDWDSCPQISKVNITVLLMTRCLCYGAGWALWRPDACSHLALRNCPGEWYQTVWERYKSLMLPYSVWPFLCAVSRLVCEACIQANWMSCPPGPEALPWVSKVHAMDVPRVVLSQRCSFTHTSDDSFLTSCTCSISKSGCFDFWVAGPISRWGKLSFLTWDRSTWICNGALRMGYSHQWHTSEWRAAVTPSLPGGSVT